MKHLTNRAKNLAYEVLSFTGEASTYLSFDERMNLLQASKLLLQYSENLEAMDIRQEDFPLEAA